MPKSPYINIHHLAKLARLELTEEEKASFGRQLPEILGYAQQISELETEGVEETAQVTGLTDVMRDDSVEQNTHRVPEEILACVPIVKDGYVVVPQILSGETDEG